MTALLIFKALLMGLVEGITEFLPISSTGHLIITGALLDFLDEEKRGIFSIFIQLGAILAVCFEYRARLIKVALGLLSEKSAQRFAINIAIAFVPAAILGLLFSHAIKTYLFFPVPVASAFIIGGLVILAAERKSRTASIDDVNNIDWKLALKIGLCQCLALFPGVSRSGATIIGGLFLGLSRSAAAEFSFFLAIPTLGSAALYDLYKGRDLLSADDVSLFAVGFVAAFISALIAIRGLIRYIKNHDFTVFAWYRIGFGLLILALTYTGIVQWAHS